LNNKNLKTGFVASRRKKSGSWKANEKRTGERLLKKKSGNAMLKNWRRRADVNPLAGMLITKMKWMEVDGTLPENIGAPSLGKIFAID
jgi:hypothetical protein